MRTHELFVRDCVEILHDDLAKGRVSRRDFLQFSALLGASAVAGGFISPARAQGSTTITVANYGGDATTFMNEAFAAPFTADTGIKVDFDGSGPLIGRIRKMVDDGAVTWDLADTTSYYGPQLGEKYLEKIDYSVVDRDQLFDWNRDELTVGNYVYSFVLAYDSSKLETKPTGWKDFFDRQKFPGKRAMYKWFEGQPEAFMLAIGAKPEEVYPFDMDTVTKMIEDMGDDLVLWDTGGLSQQLFLDGDVVMGNIWNTRARQLERDTKGRITWTFNQQIIQPGAWSIPKGAPNLAAAQRMIAASQSPERQVKLLDLMGSGPANPKALSLLSAEQQRLNPTSHMDGAVVTDAKYYAEHQSDVLDAWLSAVGA
jgi:putative spermidine/putrescine transport system substrate-binding protein